MIASFGHCRRCISGSTEDSICDDWQIRNHISFWNCFSLQSWTLPNYSEVYIIGLLLKIYSRSSVLMIINA